MCKLVYSYPVYRDRIATAKLQQLEDGVVYFEGYARKNSYKYSDIYPYGDDIPSEVYRGYLTELSGHNGGKYLMWSRYPIFEALDKTNMNKSIRGYFVVPFNRYYITSSDTMQLMFPLIAKDT